MLKQIKSRQTTRTDKSLLIENSKYSSYGMGNSRLCKLNSKEAISY